MKKRQLLLKKAAAALFAAVVLCAAPGAFAQVKIGSNPTTINAANNLEVEGSTAGRKTSIDKTTGQVTIKDGTEGAGKILTSDANGAASWQSGTSFFKVSRTTNQTITAPAGNVAAFFNINMTTELIDQDNAFDLATEQFTIVTPGTYLFTGDFTFQLSVASGASVAIFKNGQFLVNSGEAASAGQLASFNVTLMDVAATGDIYELRANTNVGTMTISRASFSGTHLR